MNFYTGGSTVLPFKARFILLALSLLAPQAVWADSGQTLLTTQTPEVKNGSFGDKNYEKGLAFYSVSPGQITAVRFWKASKESGTHIGKIWSSTGSLLASVTFANETSSGWQQQSLPSPLSIAANTTYIVSVNETNGYVAYTEGGLSSQISNGSLRSVVGNNGRWGPAGQFPANNANGINYFRDIVFVPAGISSLSLNPSSVAGGGASTGTVTLASPAPTGGAVIALSSNSAAAIVPASVTVPAGSNSRTFAISTIPVPATTAVTITASYNGSVSAGLMVTAPVLSSLTLNPNSVIGGGASTGTATLTSAAPSGGAVITLSANNPAAIVPAAVTIPAGSSSQNFTVATAAVSGTTLASISGTYNGSASATLTINSATLSSLTLNPSSVTGGSTSTGLAILSGPAPSGGAVVTLSGAAPAIEGVRGIHSANELPHDGTVKWSSLGPLFTLLAPLPQLISGLAGSAVTITTASSAPQILDACSWGGNCGWYGNFAPGESILWTSGAYQANGNWAGNGPITIRFSNPQRGLGFHIMADELGTFTATLCAYDSSDTLLACIPFVGNATTVADGSALYAGLYDDFAEISKVTVDASGASYPHDFAIGEISVASTRQPLMPLSVVVPAGATGATFTISPGPVPNTTVVNISGTYGNSRGASLTVNPPAISDISVSPDPVTGGRAALGTVRLSGPAPVGGSAVALLGANPAFAGIQAVGSAEALPGAGAMAWSSVGPLYSAVNSGLTRSIAGITGSAVTISTATGLPAEILDNCGGGDCGWYGNFAPGEIILWTSGSYDPSNGGWKANGPLTLSFNAPQRGVGFRIMADEFGAFTATLCAYDSNGALLQCVPFNGNGSSAADGSAIFIGLYDDAAEISKVTVDAGGALYPHDFAIGTLYVMNSVRQLMPSSVTVPAGDSAATFVVTPNSVNSPVSVTVTGSYNGSQQTTMHIQP